MAWGHGWWGTGAWGVCLPNGPDVQAPTLLDQVPAPGANGVLNDSPISFRITDGGAPDASHTGVDFSSLRVLIARNAVTEIAFDIVSGIHSDYLGPDSFVGANGLGGFDFILDPVVPWDIGSTVTVTVEGSDGGCNAFSTAWSFSVGACLVETCTEGQSLSVPSVGPWGVGSWGTVPWGGQGPANTVQVQGAGIPAIQRIYPAIGSTSGGQDFVILGNNLAVFEYNDIFSDAVVNPSLWTPIGAGSVTEAPYGLGGTLHCSVPSTSGRLAGLVSAALALRTDFHVEVKFEVKAFQNPSSEVVLAALEAGYDALNFISMRYLLKGPPTFEKVLRCEVWQLGNLLHVQEIPITAMSGRLGIMRYFDSVYNDNRAVFIVNGTPVFEAFDCPPCKMSCRFFIENVSSNSSIETWFDNFKSHSVVVFTSPFASRPASGVVEVSTSKIRGKTPPSDWAGAVDVRVTNGSGNGCFSTCARCFSYQFEDGFVVGRTDPYRPTRKELSILNDTALRNATPNIGHGLRRQV